MAENNPTGTATSMAITATSNVPSITGTIPNDPDEPATASSAAAAPSRSDTIGDQCVPKKKSIIEISLKNREASNNNDATIPMVVSIAKTAAAKKLRRRKPSKATRALNWGATRINANKNPIIITNISVRNRARATRSIDSLKAAASAAMMSSGASI